MKRLFTFLCLGFAGAASAAMMTFAPLSSPEHLDTEVTTNCAMTAWTELTRKFDFTLEFNATPSNNVQIAFGTDADTNIRKVKTPNTFFQRESSRDTYMAMFSGLYDRLKRYESVSDCSCTKNVIIYEGERTRNGMNTEEALERYPVRKESDYTGDQYDYMESY